MPTKDKKIYCKFFIRLLFFLKGKVIIVKKLVLQTLKFIGITEILFENDNLKEKRTLNKIISIIKKNQEIINYLIFGFFTTILSLVTYYLLTLTILNPQNAILLQLANIISWILSVSFAYLTNRKYVFKSNNRNFIKEISDFFLSRIITLLIDMIIMGIGVTYLGLSDKIFKLLSQVIVIIGNYLLSKLFVFKK